MATFHVIDNAEVNNDVTQSHVIEEEAKVDTEALTTQMDEDPTVTETQANVPEPQPRTPPVASHDNNTHNHTLLRKKQKWIQKHSQRKWMRTQQSQKRKQTFLNRNHEHRRLLRMTIILIITRY
eukprot:664618_1